MALSHSSFGTLSTDGERRGAFRRSLIESYMATATLGSVGSALVLDVSETGLGVQSVGLLNVGTSAPVRFTLPQGGTVEGTGSVAWTDETGRAGIRLVSLSATSRASLAQWLASSDDEGMVVAASEPVPSDSVAEAVAFLAANKLELNAALAYVAEKAALYSRADGSALALQDGDGMVCRASVGTAPGVGVRLQGSTGLTGECIRTAAVVRCDDTEVDPRADRLLCRRINLRSTVIVPVISSGSVIGVLEALSSRPRAFDIGHVRCLVGLAELVSVTVRPQISAPRAPARVLEPPAPPVVRTAAEPVLPRPTAAPQTGAAAAAAPAPIAVNQPKPASKTSSSQRVLLQTKAMQPPAVATAAPGPVKVGVRRVPRAAMLAIAGAAFALATGGLYLQFHPSVEVPTAHAAAPAPAAAAVAPSAVASAPAGSTVTPTQLMVPPAPADAKRREAAVTAAANKPEPQPAAPLMPLREPAAARTKESAAVAPPSLELSGGAAPSLPSVPSAMPEIQAKVSKGITEAKLVNRVDPIYPDVARQMHVEGTVEIRAVVSREGVVTNPVAISGPPVLRTAALAAVRKWRYEPSRLDGQPTERDLLITIAFHLPR